MYNGPDDKLNKKKDFGSLTVRCPKCKKVVEPDLNETTHRHVCPVCSTTVDAQVHIEKKKRGKK